ncbi:MAG: cysteine hydrolase [Flavobacteriales bacterium]|nr:cysteine hydrolase [Flavobacteriales bacterium]
MQHKALVVIDIQNDITKNYKEIIDNINSSIDWAVQNQIHVVYIRHEYLSEKIKKFKPGTFGSELTSDLKLVSDNVFAKYKGSALSSDEFAAFVDTYKVNEFYLTGADAIACVKATNNAMVKAGFKVNILSDCITSYNKKNIPEMIEYYSKKGSKIATLNEVIDCQ